MNIQYIQNIEKNKFLSENIMKFRTWVRSIKIMTKNLKIDISSFEIETKKENYITIGAKIIILLLWTFYICI